MKIKSIILNNKKITYAEINSNMQNTVILIHGLGGDYRGLIDISSCINNHRIIIPDLPGYGLSEPLDNNHTIENYAHFINSFCKKINIESFILIGHSFGGAISFMYSKLYPNSLTKLILLNPTLENDDTFLITITRIYMRAIKYMPDTISKFLLSNKLLVYLTDRSVMTKEGKSAREKILHEDYLNYKRASSKAMKECSYSLDTLHIKDYIGEQNIKTLILLGNKDLLVSPQKISFISDYLNNINIQIIDGGHLLPQENPKKVGPIINQFINN